MKSPKSPPLGIEQRTLHLKTTLSSIQLPSLADKSCAIGASLSEHYAKIFNAPESQGSQTQHQRKSHPHPQGGGVHASQKPLKKAFDPPTHPLTPPPPEAGCPTHQAIAWSGIPIYKTAVQRRERHSDRAAAHRHSRSSTTGGGGYTRENIVVQLQLLNSALHRSLACARGGCHLQVFHAKSTEMKHFAA